MSGGRSLGEARREAEAQLESAGVAESLSDARLLLAHALGATPTWVFAHESDELPAEAADRFAELVRRRAEREPLQHLVGVQEFWMLPIAVSPAVLIPRPETEHLVEWALAAARGNATVRIADIGTGSGCIVLALARELPFARLAAVDVSPAALAVARANAMELGFGERVSFLEGDLVAPLRPLPPQDLIVANLPYVSAGEWETLEPEVRAHDPRLALVGGERGTELIERLVAEAPEVLAPGGGLGLEVGFTQAREVAGLFERAGWRDVEIRKDLAGVERIVTGRRPS